MEKLAEQFKADVDRRVMEKLAILDKIKGSNLLIGEIRDAIGYRKYLLDKLRGNLEWPLLNESIKKGAPTGGKYSRNAVNIKRSLTDTIAHKASPIYDKVKKSLGISLSELSSAGFGDRKGQFMQPRSSRIGRYLPAGLNFSQGTLGETLPNSVVNLIVQEDADKFMSALSTLSKIMPGFRLTK